MKNLRFYIIALFAIGLFHQSSISIAANEPSDEIEEFNPFDSNAEDTLNAFDQAIENETGSSPFLIDSYIDAFSSSTDGCYQLSCTVYANVDKANQRITIYLNGVKQGKWPVSSGGPGHTTPDFNRHPSGRIYDAYTSNKFPGGDYNGLGNMPYAVFISGGFAIHGTPKGNWKRLGTPASHGCIRVHPEVGYYFNRLVRKVGARNTWITVN